MVLPTRSHARGITAILLESGVVTSEQVEEGLVRQRTTGLRIGETLVEMGAATEEDIGWALARQLDLPFMEPHVEALDRDLIRSFPDGLLDRLDALPLVSDGASLSVAVADPTDPDVVDELTRIAGRPITLAVAAPSTIRRMLREVLGLRPTARATLPVPDSDAHFDVQWDRSGAGFLLFHLQVASRAGASEIHFLPGVGSLEVHQRVGARLVRSASEPPAALYYLLARIEALGGPALDERQLHAAGRITCPMGADLIGLEVSLLHQEHGISVTLELRPGQDRAPTLGDLGLDPQDLARLRAALQTPSGLGLVSGPPHAGGSTTLASLLAEAGLADRRCLAFGPSLSRMPVEVRVSAIAAEAPGAWPGAAVAQCADAVVLDGVLSGEAVRGALAPEAAGRWLLVRTDWTDTFAMLEHLAGGAADRSALADRLRFVVQQRLLRIDGACALDPATGLRLDRVAAFEVLVVGDAVRASLRAGEPAERVRARAEEDGFVSLPRRLAALVASGRVTDSEASRTLA